VLTVCLNLVRLYCLNGVIVGVFFLLSAIKEKIKNRTYFYMIGIVKIVVFRFGSREALKSFFNVEKS